MQMGIGIIAILRWIQISTNICPLFVARGYTMLAAKLFGGLAILAVVFGFLGTARPNLAGDLPLHDSYVLHDTYFVVFSPAATVAYIVYSPRLLQIIIPLLSAVFALTYFAAARWSSHSLNRSFGLAHFVLMAMGVLLIALGHLFLTKGHVYVASGRMERIPPSPLWAVQVLGIGILCVAMGCLVFAVNLGRTTIKIFRLS